MAPISGACVRGPGLRLGSGLAIFYVQVARGDDEGECPNVLHLYEQCQFTTDTRPSLHRVLSVLGLALPSCLPAPDTGRERVMQAGTEAAVSCE